MRADTLRTINDVLAAARRRIRRYTPAEAHVAAGNGCLIVDTRDSADRIAEGVIPGSIWVPRNTLEWRADSSSEAPDPRLAASEETLIVVCNDGYSSSLAAASLVELGRSDAGDVIGGFRAWAAAGLPVDRDTPRHPDGTESPTMNSRPNTFRGTSIPIPW